MIIGAAGSKSMQFDTRAVFAPFTGVLYFKKESAAHHVLHCTATPGERGSCSALSSGLERPQALACVTSYRALAKPDFVGGLVQSITRRQPQGWNPGVDMGPRFIPVHLAWATFPRQRTVFVTYLCAWLPAACCSAP